MPTYEVDAEFLRDWRKLSPAHRERFKAAVRKLVADLKSGRAPRPGLGIERFEGHEGVFEFRWAPDGRALFAYGSSPHPGDVHII